MLQAAFDKSKTHHLNYLLVMPRIVNSVKDSYGFPLGIAYVSACLKQAGFKLNTLNLNQIEGRVDEIIKDKIRQDRIDVVLTGGLSAEYCMIRTIIDAAKSVDTRIITVVGGGIISADPEIAMDALEHVDYGVIGEGEITAIELCDAIETSGDFSQVNGLIYPAKNGKAGGMPLFGKYIKTKPRKVIDDLDTIPWPDFEGFNIEQYLAATLGTAGFNGGNTLAMISARSCPFGCTFCFHTIGRKHRSRSLEDFFKELDYYLSKYEVKTLSINDDLFGVKEERLIEFCKIMIEKNYGIKWMGAFRLTQVNPTMLKYLKEANCSGMGFGLESADNSILKSMKKQMTIEQAEASLKMVADAGIAISACLIIGDPEDTLETAEVSFDWWKKHPEYYIPIRLITPYPGTPIYHYACANGFIKDKVQFLRDCAPQINISKMSDEQLQDFTKRVMEVSYKDIKKMSTFSYRKIDGGCVDIAGQCSECGHENEWEKVRLFKLTFVSCQKCGQQYFPPLNDAVRENIDRNMAVILNETKGKVGLWGMTFHTIDVIEHSELLQGDRVVLIDICGSKQHKDFFGKEIYSPYILDKEAIDTVIISAPNHIGFIQSQLETNYKLVTKIIDISRLTDAEFDSSGLGRERDERHALHLDGYGATL
jgi:anaerobic magnesium-protoporphyrin IX monomethyl ester cyclase